MRRMLLLFWALLLALSLATGCSNPGNRDVSGENGSPTSDSTTADLRIVSGSENRPLEPLIQRFAQQNHVHIAMDYQGSVDMMRMLQNGEIACDAVWPASSLWIDLGDTQKRVKNEKSILWSPVVFGVKKSVAQKLGWVGKKEVKVEEILQAAESGRLRFMMTSATQSNSGAAAYLGFLYAFAGKPDILSSSDLAKPDVRAKIKRILGSVNRTSGSSGFLKDLFLQKYDGFDAMVNYEAVVIDTNQELLKQGKEPLYAIYPSDGLAIADSPLGYIDRKDANKEALFQKLQEYLLSPPIQREISGLGRRVGPVGEELKAANASAFNTDWGINTKQFFNQIRYPKAEVIREALDLYQTAFRKPSFTVYCLDYSGSMEGTREKGLKAAMKMILDSEQSKQNLLQASPEDVTIVVTFSDRVLDTWTVAGNDPAALNDLWNKINTRAPDGGTAIYSAAMLGLDRIKEQGNLGKYFPAVILMTDGESNTGANFQEFQSHLAQLGLSQDVPIFAILFGEASSRQLDEITQATSGKVFDGKKDLARAFRDAKGYN